MNQTFCSLTGRVLQALALYAQLPSCSAFQRMAVVCIIALASSCNSTTNSNIKTTGTSSIQYILPAGNLSAVEKTRLKNGAEAWYDSVLKKRGFNGSMLVAKNGNIVFEVYNGSAHVGKEKDDITNTTAFHIASVSKTFTAMAVLKLAEASLLNTDDEFSKYFPQFNYAGVTIRNLMNHRSGLPNYTYFMEDLGWNKKTYITNEDVLSYLVTRKGQIKNIGTPDTRFTYCNTNYALLALLIEKVSGKKYGTYLNETFFAPLQMKHTFVFAKSDSGNVLPSYDYRGGVIALNFLDLVYGDKNIYSTPKDLLAWDRALTSGLLFNKKTLEAAYTPYSNEKPGVRNYGLGWRMNLYPTGKKMIYHNGWWHGNNAAFIRLVEDSATIIVLGNKYNRGIYHANALANLFGNYLQADEESDLEPVIKNDKPLKKSGGVINESKAKKTLPSRAEKKR